MHINMEVLKNTPQLLQIINIIKLEEILWNWSEEYNHQDIWTTLIFHMENASSRPQDLSAWEFQITIITEENILIKM